MESVYTSKKFESRNKNISQKYTLSNEKYPIYLYLFSRYAILVFVGETPIYLLYNFPMTLQSTQNTELLRKISVAGLHIDDTREILRIFPVLTEEKQLQILETWDSITANIKLHREELEQEKEILLIKALENIESDLEAYGRTLVQSGAKKDLSGLKFQI